MPTSRSIEQIRYNTEHAIFSSLDHITLLRRYDEIMEHLKVAAPKIYELYKEKEKER